MTDLITLDEYKEAQSISSATNDVRTEALIDSVSQLVKTYCGNSIVDYYTTPKVEVQTVEWATSLIQLDQSPINSIVTVEERADMGSSYVTLDSTEYYLDTSTDIVIRSNGTTQAYWATGPGSVRVTYTAGYEYTPADLRLAVIDLVTYYLKDEHKQHLSLGSAAMGNQGSSSQDKNVGFPDHIKRVLDFYKQIL